MFEIYTDTDREAQRRQMNQASMPAALVQCATGILFLLTGCFGHGSFHRWNLITGSIFVPLGCYQLWLVRRKRQLDEQDDFPSSTDNRDR